MLQLGQQLPAVQLFDQDGNSVSLREELGSPLVVFFYPKDETMGCTIEVCTFRDHYDEFVDAGAKVYGISADSVSSHKKFSTSQNLNFPLLSDKKKEAIKAFGVPRKLLGLVPGRVTYIFDRKGKLVHSFDSAIGFKKHISESLQVIKKLTVGQNA